ncbi:hypothetical protein [Enterococcus raffinosus]|uniref:hypothetical protein n=1 Tax=Enterococcus raffinosus TaxID=71452 RepID=UPI003AD29034
MVSREEYIEELKELLSDDPTMAEGREKEIIYKIDDINVYGGFEMGVRGTDHHCLLFDGVSWGTVVVPETQSYISDHLVEQFENLGFKNLPTNDNHLRGFKDVTEIVEFNMETKELLDSQYVESPAALFSTSKTLESGNSVGVDLKIEKSLTERPNKFEQRKAAAVEKNKMIEKNIASSQDKKAVNDLPIMK